MSYIGQTGMNFGDRWDHHRVMLRANKHGNRLLQDDWNKYGEQSFVFEPVEIVDDTTYLDDLEEYYIAIAKSEHKAYNLTDGGKEPVWKGKHLSESTKRKIGEKNREHMTGRKLSDETRKKMSESQKARVYSEEEKLAYSLRAREMHTGQHVAESTKEKLRKINQDNPPGAKYTVEDIKNIRAAVEAGESLKDVAAKYHTTPSYISAIAQRRRWKHVE